ncbi:MAG: hypothetical protein HFJ91_08775 [Muribaculaceae bacterium]|nr:hypothetical protein [Muribaculaceae bacterium]
MRAGIAAILMLLSLCHTAAADTTGVTTTGVSPFVWGAEAGTGIDMGGDDMSSLNISVLAGYRNEWLRIAGIGLGIDMMISNSCRAYPIYGIVRTSFSRTPKLVFADMRCGIAFNRAPGIPDRTNLFVQPGVGIDLAKGKTFGSYLVLSYTYNSMTFKGDKADTLVHGLNHATLTLGVNF